jgi:signal peptidase II
LSSYLKSYAFLGALSGSIIAADQITKMLVRANLSFADTWTPWPWMAPYFMIVNWRNTGAAFGMLQGLNTVFMVLSIVVSLAIIYYFPRISQNDSPLRLALVLQLGGAIGNLIDRFIQGYVTDFIALLPSLNMPVFNIADLSITMGVVVLVIGVWMKERGPDEEASEDLGADGLARQTPEEPYGE